ncbi:MAG: hypothetical protein EZS28_001876 [Streblomastix strix]|uniref:Uncharacterized protein n=1 Tax=Streblomastix strix TaxID=222440 RepID=A0A5J4X5S5_9EUKA|nr:MAG: hypothetical protein EZS28_001876 [Streblomastix strix]
MKSQQILNYSPDEGSTVSILIEGDPQSLQTASFGMKDISWFDFDNKHYGVFVSNDGRIFTGSEKDFDPPLKKNPPIYSEVEQSHNINDEEQQIIID